MAKEKEKKKVLVAILTARRNLKIAKERHWYHIRKSPVEGRLKERWPPDWIAFYQLENFGPDKWRIEWYAKVVSVEGPMERIKLFPTEPTHIRAHERYYKVNVETLKKLKRPITSKKGRRIDFIPTTYKKLMTAEEINDLFDDSPLEDKLWQVLKRWKIPAERQEYVTPNEDTYRLDFAIYCNNGKIAVETDGDTWHCTPEQAAIDNLRANALVVKDWDVIRFNTKQIKEQMASYCLPTIREKIDRLGDLKGNPPTPKPSRKKRGEPGPDQIDLFGEEVY